MEELYSIEHLDPIERILDYHCTPDQDATKIYSDKFYKYTPIFLVGAAFGLDSCSSGVIHLSLDVENQEITTYPSGAQLKCQVGDKRFTFFLINLFVKRPDGSIVTSHDHILVFDRGSDVEDFSDQYKIIEIYGEKNEWSQYIIDYLISLFQGYLTDYRYVDNETCKQYIIIKHLCQAFTLLTLVLQIHNPEISFIDIINMWDELPPAPKLVLVESFICYMNAYIDYYKLDILTDHYKNMTQYLLEYEFPHIQEELDDLYLNFDLDGILKLSEKERYILWG